MPSVISKDGTSIAYERTGNGPLIILVNGALSHRKLNGEKELAEELAKNFTVIFYDRRGRGESTDTKPYIADKEIEDLEALIDEAGGTVYLYGSSSGAVLSLLTAEKLGAEKIIKLALYEPPYNSGNDIDKQKFADEKKKINELVSAGKPAEAVTAFLEGRGTPPDIMEGIKKSPDWENLVEVGNTLIYDFEVLGDGTIPPGIEKNILMPTLIMDGEKSFDFIHAAADRLGEIIPGAIRNTLKDQTHEVSPRVIAPLLKAFFAGEK